MRPKSNPLDLNNLPEDYSTAAGCMTKKSGGKDGKDECGNKVYECRFCSLKFCKSQALGGHMNRHRQERETETLNRARQLVFNNSAAQGGLLSCHPMAPGGSHSGGSIGDPYTSACPPRLFSGSSSTHLPPPTSLRPPQPPPYQSHLYTSSSSPQPPYPSQHPQHPINDYYIGHVLDNMGAPDTNSYTCIGEPVGHGGLGPGSDQGSSKNGSLSHRHHQDQEGLNWGRGYAAAGGGGGEFKQRLDSTSSSNRFQDGF